MNKKCFLGIDMQYDFIENGKLAVNGGTEALEICAKHLSNNEYAFKVLTCDFHPSTHSSFKENGGIWPTHCVEHSHGASIFEPVINAANNTSGITKILTKGVIADKEEYSIFDNPMAKLYLANIFKLANFDEYHICGIAGDFCVLNSLKGLMELVPNEKIVVILNCTASIDGDNHTLIEFCREHNIKML